MPIDRELKFVCASGTEALRRSEGHSGSIDLLVTDVVTPGVSGREPAERLIDSRPAARVLYISGYTDDAIVHGGVLDDEMYFLQKPFTLRALAGNLRAVMESPSRGLPDQ